MRAMPGGTPFGAGILGEVEPGLPASKAGLKPGDEIVGIDGRKVLYFPSVALAIQTGDGKPVTFDVIRDGKQFQVKVQPTYAELMGEKRWRVGFCLPPRKCRFATGLGPGAGWVRGG